MEAPITVKFAEIEDNFGIRVRIPAGLIKANQSKARARNCCICLDKSGSMQDAFSSAKEAVLRLLLSLRNRGVDCSLLVYDSSAQCHPTNDLSDEKLTKLVAQLQAGGGTNFTEAFCYLCSLLENSDADPAIVFFSDGQDMSDNTPDKRHVNQAFTLLQNALKKPGVASEVHSIGFTPEHDAVLLSRIARLGTSQGTFQYVRTVEEISEALDTVLEMTVGPKVASFLMLPGLEPVPLLLDEVNSATLFLHRDDFKPDGSVIVRVGDSQFEIALEREGDKALNGIIIKYIESEVQRLHDELVARPDRKALDAISERIRGFDDRLNQLVADCFKMSRNDRKIAMQDILTIKDLIQRFLSDLAAAYTNSLDNDRIANFAAMAYKKITKNSLKKKMDQRVANNVQMMDELEERIQEVVKTIDINLLEANVTEDEKDGLVCAFSMKNFIEALSEGDCLCATVQIARSPAAIADPSQLTIKQVCTTILTADTFMDSLKHSVEAAENPEAVHGGFSRDALASVAKGISREDITGICPLYINAEHWKVAKLKMKPVMGWNTTLDIMGYAYSQVKTIPFLILAKVIEEAAGGSEFKKKQFDMISRTCEEIYRDAKMRDELQDLYFKYTRSPENRTIDVIPHNFVFLGHLLAAVKAGEINLSSDEVTLNKFIQQLTEEEVRRRLNYGFDAPETDDLCDLLGVDKKYFITDPIARFEEQYKAYMQEVRAGKGASPWKAAMLTLLGADHQPVATSNVPSESSMVAPTVEAPEFAGEIELTDTAINFIRNACKVVSRNVHLIKQFSRLLMGEGSLEENYENEIDWNMEDKKLFAMLLQCFLQRRNSDRRNAISNKQYFDPLVPGMEISVFKRIVDDIVISERNRKVNDIMNAEAAKNSSNIALVFGATDDSQEAAGILKMECRSIGARDGTFKRCMQALFDPNCPDAADKIKMLSSGQYHGITLLSTRKLDHAAPTAWVPSRSNFAKIWAAQMHVFSKEEWLSMFPTLAEHIERKYQVLDGTYVGEK